MLGGIKNISKEDEAKLVAESWAKLAFDSQYGNSLTAYHDYLMAKNPNREKREKNEAYQNPKYQQSSRQFKAKA